MNNAKLIAGNLYKLSKLNCLSYDESFNWQHKVVWPPRPANLIYLTNEIFFYINSIEDYSHGYKILVPLFFYKTKIIYPYHTFDCENITEYLQQL